MFVVNVTKSYSLEQHSYNNNDDKVAIYIERSTKLSKEL